MTYIVWVDNGTGGWSASGDLPNLADVLKFITSETYGHPYRVTKEVSVCLVEEYGALNPRPDQNTVIPFTPGVIGPLLGQK